ncbi:hypothetical protein AAG906_020748 [Vitis piasezkii]
MQSQKRWRSGWCLKVVEIRAVLGRLGSGRCPRMVQSGGAGRVEIRCGLGKVVRRSGKRKIDCGAEVVQSGVVSGRWDPAVSRKWSRQVHEAVEIGWCLKFWNQGGLGKVRSGVVLENGQDSLESGWRSVWCLKILESGRSWEGMSCGLEKASKQSWKMVRISVVHRVWKSGQVLGR